MLINSELTEEIFNTYRNYKSEKNFFYWAKTKKNAIIPDKKNENAGYDIYACFDEDFIFIEPHQTKLVPTGIASAISSDYYFQIEERGSTGSKGIKHSAGVIDSGYRGEWFLAVTNTNESALIISKFSKEALIERIQKVRTGERNSYIQVLKTNEGNKIVSDNLCREIIYPYHKALFQAVLHKVHSYMKPKVISYEELKGICSERGEGNLGSSGK